MGRFSRAWAKAARKYALLPPGHLYCYECGWVGVAWRLHFAASHAEMAGIRLQPMRPFRSPLAAALRLQEAQEREEERAWQLERALHAARLHIKERERLKPPKKARRRPFRPDNDGLPEEWFQVMAIDPNENDDGYYLEIGEVDEQGNPAELDFSGLGLP